MTRDSIFMRTLNRRRSHKESGLKSFQKGKVGKARGNPAISEFHVLKKTRAFFVT